MCMWHVHVACACAARAPLQLLVGVIAPVLVLRFLAIQRTGIVMRELHEL